MRKYLILLFVLPLLFSCKKGAENTRYTAFDGLMKSGKALSLGDERDVYVFCDSEKWAGIHDLLSPAIEREIKLVYPEKYFNLHLMNIKDFSEYSNYRNLLFIGDLASEDAVSQHIRETLDKALLERISASGGDLFSASNFYSRDQLILYLVGSNPINLVTLSALQSQNIFQLLIKRYRERLGYQAYQVPIIPADFFQDYPFELKVPNNFRLYSNDKNGNFLSLLYRARSESREVPDKYLSIYHQELPEADFDFQWLIQSRARIGEKYFEGDSFKAGDLKQEKVHFAGHEALRITGSWVNMNHKIGGAFQTHAFWEAGTAYLVDSSVYYPAGDKLPSIVELNVIGNSLRLR